MAAASITNAAIDRTSFDLRNPFMNGSPILEIQNNKIVWERVALPSLVDHAAVTRKWWIGEETIMNSLFELRLCNILRLIDEFLRYR